MAPNRRPRRAAATARATTPSPPRRTSRRGRSSTPPTEPVPESSLHSGEVSNPDVSNALPFPTSTAYAHPNIGMSPERYAAITRELIEGFAPLRAIFGFTNANPLATSLSNMDIPNITAATTIPRDVMATNNLAERPTSTGLSAVATPSGGTTTNMEDVNNGQLTAVSRASQPAVPDRRQAGQFQDSSPSLQTNTPSSVAVSPDSSTPVIPSSSRPFMSGESCAAAPFISNSVPVPTVCLSNPQLSSGSFMPTTPRQSNPIEQAAKPVSGFFNNNEIKVPKFAYTYDGVSNWSSFISMFEINAQKLKWSDDQACLTLLRSLSGQALDIAGP